MREERTWADGLSRLSSSVRSNVPHLFQKGAFKALVEEFRKWNWEWNYDDYLLDLTSGLQKTRDWPLLKELWVAVIAKRRTNYNKTKKAQKSLPEKIPETLVTKTKDLLLDSLRRLQQYASELGHESDVAVYLEMIVRVEKQMKA